MIKQLKTILFCILFLGFLAMAMPANAQFSAGARAGISFTTDSYTGFQHEFLALPYGGIFGQYTLPIPLDLQLGINYAAEGSNLKDLGTGSTTDLRHNYLTIPLMVQYRFAFGGYVEAGPEVGFLLNANAKTDGGPSVDEKPYLKSTDFELGLGFGYEFNHKAANGLGISVRYLRGLSNIDQSGDESTNATTRNLNVGLTYRFGPAKKTAKQ